MIDWIERIPWWLAALAWVVVPAVTYVRVRRSTSVSAYAPARGTNLPRVSVIVPARDEAPNIERCVRSLLASTYTNAEFIFVDDHSSDGTGALARGITDRDARARVTSPAALPAGWFGKQWACAHGASLATGELLLFTDADTWHAPDLLARAVTALNERHADFLSIVGRLETGSFWEHVVQPAMGVAFYTLFGGTEELSRTRTPRRKLASGQYLLVRRDVYDALGGHEAVRTFVAEDVMLAQQWTAAGRVVHVVSAIDHLHTRMYRSLPEIVAGWGKNMWAGGRHFLGANPVVLAVARVLGPFPALLTAVPIVAIVLALAGVLSPWWWHMGALAYLLQTLVTMALYARAGARVWYAWLYPLACVVISYITARAAIRGSRTEWKGRTYEAA